MHSGARVGKIKSCAAARPESAHCQNSAVCRFSVQKIGQSVILMGKNNKPQSYINGVGYSAFDFSYVLARDTVRHCQNAHCADLLAECGLGRKLNYCVVWRHRCWRCLLSMFCYLLCGEVLDFYFILHSFRSVLILKI